MYVKYGYYSNNYKGTLIPKEDFQRAEQEAETYIRYLTYLNGDIFADEAHTDPVVMDAVCAAAEAYYTATMEQRQGGNVKSENKDGMSVSFVVARKDGETVDEYTAQFHFPWHSLARRAMNKKDYPEQSRGLMLGGMITGYRTLHKEVVLANDGDVPTGLQIQFVAKLYIEMIEQNWGLSGKLILQGVRKAKKPPTAKVSFLNIY